jgi:hypothetical protein
MKSCPYCSKQFKTWKSVRGHNASCSKNTGEYFVDLLYGPIHYSELEIDGHINLLKDKFPLLNFTAVRHTFNKRNLLLKPYNKSYSKEDCILLVKDWVLNNSKIPQCRDWQFCVIKKYPCLIVIQELFGSWNNMIEQSGFNPNINDGFGNRQVALDGVLYRSNLEVLFVNKFLFNKETYSYEDKYLNHNKFYDFYILSRELYIEIDGGCRPEITLEKIAINKDLNRRLLIVTSKDINSFKNLNKMLSFKDV